MFLPSCQVLAHPGTEILLGHWPLPRQQVRPVITSQKALDHLELERYFVLCHGIPSRVSVDADLTALPVSSIVEVKAAGGERAVDRNIAGVVRQGLYRSADHLVQLRQEGASDPQTTIDVHVRRLEALRRAGIAERVTDGVWRVPPDFMSSAQAHDAQETAGVTVELRSHLPIKQQVRAQGATWLDRQMMGDAKKLSPQGFGAQVGAALQERVGFLVEQGLAERRGSRVVLARNLLSTLRDRELTEVGKVIQNETGLIHRPLTDEGSTSGVYRRSVQLASGRFAMLDDGIGFSLMPWRPSMDRRLGRSMTAVVRGTSVNWGVVMERGLSL